MATTLGIEPFLLQLLKRLAVPLGAEQPRGRSANIGTRPRLVKREVCAFVWKHRGVNTKQE